MNTTSVNVEEQKTVSEKEKKKVKSKELTDSSLSKTNEVGTTEVDITKTPKAGKKRKKSRK